MIDEYQALEETAEILSDAATLDSLKAGLDELARGETMRLAARRTLIAASALRLATTGGSNWTLVSPGTTVVAMPVAPWEAEYGGGTVAGYVCLPLQNRPQPDIAETGGKIAAEFCD